MSVETQSFSREEAEDLKKFLASSVGKKVLQVLDNRVEEKNNLLKVVNLAGNAADFPEIGRRCTLHATECRIYLEVIDFLKTVGDDYVSED